MRQVAQQWTGINVILYYAATLFASMGIDEGSASTSLVIANALLLCAGTVPGMLLVEHRWAVRAPCPCPCMLDKAAHWGTASAFRRNVGRRKLLVVGGVAMTVSHAGVCLAVSAAAALAPGSAGANALSWIGVVCMYAFTVSFAATWGPVVWVYQNEVLPLRVRAVGTAAA